VGVVCAVSLLAARLAGWGWSAGSDPPPTFSPRLGRGWAAGLLFGGAFFCTTTTPPPPPGCSIVDPVSLQTTHCIELEDNEAALSVCLVSFDSHPEHGTLLAVGTAQGLKFYPKEAQSGWRLRLRSAPACDTAWLAWRPPSYSVAVLGT
jgi:hypothetical protein